DRIGRTGVREGAPQPFGARVRGGRGTPGGGPQDNSRGLRCPMSVRRGPRGAVLLGSARVSIGRPGRGRRRVVKARISYRSRSDPERTRPGARTRRADPPGDRGPRPGRRRGGRGSRRPATPWYAQGGRTLPGGGRLFPDPGALRSRGRSGPARG